VPSSLADVYSHHAIATMGIDTEYVVQTAEEQQPASMLGQ
jgi:hypothetical protein